MSLKLADRVAWAIQTIKADKEFDKGITNLELAKKLGTNKDTLAGYSRGEGLLKGEVVENIVELYKFNPLWLFKGDGEPFPGARVKYPEVCAREAYTTAEPLTPGVNEAAGQYNEPGQIKVSDDMVLAAKVLESETPYAVALHLNIHSFARAIGAEERITHLEKKVKDLEMKVDDMIKDGCIKPGSSAGSKSDTGAGESLSSSKREAM